MKRPFRNKSAPEAPAEPAAGRTDAVSRIRHFTEDDDRPSREDRNYGQTIFTRPPVPLPRLLTGKRRR
jgi:hypothetical protein